MRVRYLWASAVLAVATGAAAAGAAVPAARNAAPTPRLAAALTARITAGRTAGAGQPASNGPVVVRAASSPFGRVLVTGQGRALYAFSGDAFPFSTSNPAEFQLDCTALNTSNGTPSGVPCTTRWPPLLATGALVAGPGVRGKELGTVTRDGVTQVTYAGHPLYMFVGDTAPGQFNGEDVAAFKGVFWLVSPDGRPDAGVATVQTEVSPNGVVLAAQTAGGTHRSLYLLTLDPPSHTTCTGDCTAVWPPLLTSRRPRAGIGVNKHLLGVLRRPDGTLQVTYDHHPVYMFAFDLGTMAPSGLTNGEDFADSVQHGIWYTVSPRGAPDPGTATVRSESNAAYGPILSVTSAFTGAPVTLYAFSADTSSMSRCTGSCAIYWPPVITSTPPAAAGDANGSSLGVIPRGDGTFQVTYDGHPLYYFSAGLDSGTSGAGVTAFGGTFNVVRANGTVG